MVTGVSLGSVLITVTSGAGGACPDGCSFFSARTDKGNRAKIKTTRKIDVNREKRGMLICDPYFSFFIMKSDKYQTNAAELVIENNII
jgi:hypothetical protein